MGFYHRISVLLIALSLFFISCQKEQPQPINNNSNQTITYGPGPDGPVFQSTVYNGSLVIMGPYTSNDGDTNSLSAWNGTNWSYLPVGRALYDNYPGFGAICVYNGNLIAGCNQSNIYQWNGSILSDIGVVSPIYHTICAMTTYNGNLILGGVFDSINGVQANNIAMWNGSSWSPLGVGCTGGVSALTVYNGNLIVGGFFDSAGGSTVGYIAQWNGTNWTTLGGGFNSAVFALITFNGNLVAAGEFTSTGVTSITDVAQWNGSAWQSLATLNGINAFNIYNNNLVACTGTGLQGGPCVFQWNGSGWQNPFGNFWCFQGRYPGPPVGVSSLTVYNGNLVACGSFNNAGNLKANSFAQWNGSTWGLIQ